MNPLEKLEARANILYDREESTETWIANFTPRELVHLWYYYCTYTPFNDTPSAFDDEVYNALYRIGYWEFLEDKEINR